MIRDRTVRKPSRPGSRPGHWRSFWRRMLWLAALSAALAVAALEWVRQSRTATMPWQGQLAVGAGVFFTMLLTGALMSLIFTSARGGHDAAVLDFDKEG